MRLGAMSAHRHVGEGVGFTLRAFALVGGPCAVEMEQPMEQRPFGSDQRVMPAFLSIAASSPASRQAA